MYYCAFGNSALINRGTHTVQVRWRRRRSALFNRSTHTMRGRWLRGRMGFFKLFVRLRTDFRCFSTSLLRVSLLVCPYKQPKVSVSRFESFFPLQSSGQNCRFRFASFDFFKSSTSCWRIHFLNGWSAQGIGHPQSPGSNQHLAFVYGSLPPFNSFTSC